MLPTLDGTRKHRPPRRSSCAACIRAKRRCDPGLLACTRCTKQGLDCHYFSHPTTSTSREAISSAESSQLPFSQQVVTREVSNFTPFQGLDNDLFPMFPIFDEDAVDHSIEVLRCSQVPSPTVPALPFSMDSCLSEIPAFPASRFNYGIDELKLAPSKMVLQNETPWSHPLLYEDRMPTSMHDALAACSLYTAKNDINSEFVLRHIRLRARELLVEPNPGTSLDILSRAQALLLYLIILVFDGDILARAQAETAIPRLESFALSIKSLLDEEEEIISRTLPLYPTGPARIAWKSWIFRESARRTFLICYFFLSLYHSLKENGQYCHDHPEVSNKWTASAHLWNAPSILDFSIAWEKRRHLVILNLDHAPLLADGDPSEVDAFGRIVIVTQLGIDDARGWFYSRGGCL